jgi:hypothetical protein
VVWLVVEGDLIQDAIDDAAIGDVLLIGDGEYAENIVVNKAIEIIGAVDGNGEATVTLTAASGQTGITISASDVTLRNLSVVQRTTGERYARGISFSANVTAQTYSNITIDGASVGMGVGSGTNVNGLTITNSHFDNNVQGWYFAAETSASTNGTSVENVSVTNTTFNGNTQKGIYVEKLDNAVFDGITVQNSGVDSTYGFNAGIDVNLKWQSYSNLTIRNSTITGSGVYGTASSAHFPVAVSIKGRDDSPSYSTNPGSLANVLIEDTLISGPENALRFGEVNKTNLSPTNVVVRNSSLIGGNATGTTGFSIINLTPVVVNASGNWFGSNVESTISGRISGVSSVDFNAYLNTGTNSVTSGPGFEGDFSSVVVTTLGAQTGSTGRVQEAQNMVTAGGTVHVNSGTYVEQVNVTKSLSLLSINGAASTVITSSTGGYVGAITVATGVKNVTIGDANKGFTLNANAGNPAALYLVQDNDGAVVKGNIVNGGVTGAVLTGGAQDSVLFESNAFSN